MNAIVIIGSGSPGVLERTEVGKPTLRGKQDTGPSSRLHDGRICCRGLYDPIGYVYSRHKRGNVVITVIGDDNA